MIHTKISKCSHSINTLFPFFEYTEDALDVGVLFSFSMSSFPFLLFFCFFPSVADWAKINLSWRIEAWEGRPLTWSQQQQWWWWWGLIQTPLAHVSKFYFDKTNEISKFRLYQTVGQLWEIDTVLHENFRSNFSLNFSPISLLCTPLFMQSDQKLMESFHDFDPKPCRIFCQYIQWSRLTWSSNYCLAAGD